MELCLGVDRVAEKGFVVGSGSGANLGLRPGQCALGWVLEAGLIQGEHPNLTQHEREIPSDTRNWIYHCLRAERLFNFYELT